MKPIIILLIITLMLFTTYWIPIVFGEEEENIEVITKDLIVKEDCDAYDLLLYPGYQIISSNVDFNNSGTYYVYYHNNLGDEFVKKVIVLAQENDSYCQEQMYTSSTSETYYEEILATCPIDENRYAYCYAFDEKEDTSGGRSFFINIMESDKRVYTQLLLNNCIANITDLKKDENYIIGTGWKKDASGNIQIWLFRINLLTRTRELCYYGGTGDSYPKSLAISQLSYFLCGSTSSIDYPFEGEREENDSFILEISKENFEIKTSQRLGKPGNDEITNSFIQNNYLFLTQCAGEETSLIKLDLFGNVMDSLTLDYPYSQTVKKYWLGRDQKQYLLISKYQYDLQANIDELFLVEDGLHSIYQCQDGSILDMKVNEMGYYTILMNNSQGTKLESYYLKDGEMNLFFSKEYQSEFDPFEMGAYNGNIIIGTNLDRSVVEVHAYDYVKIENYGTNQIISENTSITDYEVIINNLPRNHDLKSIINYDITRFGTYEGRFHFSTSNLDFCYPTQIEVIPLISVREGESYDNNFQITFNGEAFLNNQAIANGHRINEVGDYLLEVRGKDECKLINFKVENISVHPAQNEIYNIYSAEKGEYSMHENEKEMLLSFQSQNDKTNSLNSRSEVWLFLLPVCTSLAGILFLIRNR